MKGASAFTVLFLIVLDFSHLYSKLIPSEQKNEGIQESLVFEISSNEFKRTSIDSKLRRIKSFVLDNPVSKYRKKSKNFSKISYGSEMKLR